MLCAAGGRRRCGAHLAVMAAGRRETRCGESGPIAHEQWIPTAWRTRGQMHWRVWRKFTRGSLAVYEHQTALDQRPGTQQRGQSARHVAWPHAGEFLRARLWARKPDGVAKLLCSTSSGMNCHLPLDLDTSKRRPSCAAPAELRRAMEIYTIQPQPLPTRLYHFAQEFAGGQVGPCQRPKWHFTAQVTIRDL